jgi:alkyl sulfatase BDS1-like metallo-beta-lactamase superfamily hydrolase
VAASDSYTSASSESYGQVESHVRQVYNGNIGWFDGDVYEINPLAVREEAERVVQAMGGRAAVARALGQRTDSANARGFYITEALQMEGGMQFNGQSLTIDAIRRFVGTPTAQALVAASVDENLQFVRYLVDPRKADGLRQTFTLAVEGDSRVRRLELRNGVIVISDSAAAAPTHVKLTRQELAAFVLGTRAPSETDPLSQLDRVLDRSHLMPPGAVESVMKGMQAGNDLEH